MIQSVHIYCVLSVYCQCELSVGLRKEAISESVSLALHTMIAFARAQKGEQSIGGMGGVTDYFGGSTKVA